MAAPLKHKHALPNSHCCERTCCDTGLGTLGRFSSNNNNSKYDCMDALPLMIIITRKIACVGEMGGEPSGVGCLRRMDGHSQPSISVPVPTWSSIIHQRFLLVHCTLH
ncbi:hypothetical protein T11_174 [Trichinella zimbabwensis]|uniref:Uncharacterized protein n=1 Tax=Trichinella zimbabwensis TaxID=268475 RepID=A0A0V1H6W6_9BILA|nr:hypothetical protein T11_174 [Trichinella zimbabwensis]